MDSKASHPTPPPPPPPTSTSSPPPPSVSSICPPKKIMTKHDRPPLRHRRKAPLPLTLYETKSWSPDIHREEAWLRRKESHLERSLSSTKSLTDSDMDELKACLELGFAFDSSTQLDTKLTQTFPALEFYHDVLNKKFPKTRSSSSLSSVTDCDSPTIPSSPNSIIEQGDDPKMVKMRLRHWAQAVAFSLRTPSPK